MSVKILNNTAAWPISKAQASMTASVMPLASEKNDTACIVDTNPTQTYKIANNAIYIARLLNFLIAFICLFHHIQ
jgi:hypothetical protein